MSDKYRLLIESMPVAFAYHQLVTDDEGNPVDYIFLHVNKAFTNMTGLPMDRVTGKKVTEVFPVLKSSPFDWIGTYGQVALSGEAIRFNEYFEPLKRWYEVTAYSDAPGFFAIIFRNITENKKFNDVLLKREAQFQVLKDFPIIVAQTDQDLRYTWIYNPHPDFDPENVIGKRDDEVAVNAGTQQLVELKRQVVQSGSTARAEITFPLAEGERTYDIAAEPLHDDLGMVVGATTAAFDITESKQAKQDVKDAHENLLSVLESIDAFIYVADMETHEMLFSNRYAKNLHGNGSGTKCWQLIQAGQKGPCSFCTNNKLLDAAGRPTGVYKWEFQNTKNGRWYNCRDTAIRWVDGRTVRLEIATNITEYKQAQTKLHKEKNELAALLDEILDTTTIWIDILDLDGNVTFWNKAAAEISGYTAEDVTGHAKVWEWMFPDPAYRAEIHQTSRNSLQDGRRAENLETRMKRKDGAYRTILWHSSNLVENGKVVGRISLGTDISQRKQVEAALHESNKKLQASHKNYRSLADNTPDHIYTLDRDFRFTAVNKSLCQTMMLEEHEIIGKTHRQLGFPDPLVQDWEEQFRKAFYLKKAVTAETTAPMPDGTTPTYEYVMVPVFDENGCVTRIRGTSRDITERNLLEQEIFKADKLESIGTLAGGIAHDLNNYLATLLGNTSLAKLYTDNPQKVMQKLENIEQATLRAKALSNQLFAFAKGAAPVKKTVSLNQFMFETIHFSLSGSPINCDYAVAENLHLVEIDEAQFSQVLNNIILNAVQAMPEGGTIRVMADNVTNKRGSGAALLPLPEGNYIKITIQDKGIGISEKYLTKIFDPFFTTKQKGSGLGLATAYTIMQNHGGHISVTSEAGVGTTFYLYLPASTRPVNLNDTEEIIACGSGRILVMDDQEDYLAVTGETLSSLGYQASLARDGWEAITIYMEALKKEQPFDLVIMDLTVPGGMGGKETIKELLQKDPKAKVVVASGYSNDPIMANFNEYGFIGVLKKPFTIAELSKLVWEVTNDKRAEQPDDVNQN